MELYGNFQKLLFMLGGSTMNEKLFLRFFHIKS